MTPVRPYKKDNTGKLWTLDYKNYLGIREQVRFPGSKSDAKSALNRIIEKQAKIKYGLELPETRLTLEEAFEEFIENLKYRGRKEKTVKRYRVALQALALTQSLKHPMSAFTIRTFQSFQKKRAKSVSPHTLASDIRHLKAFFQWLEDYEYITKSPLRKFKYDTPESIFKNAEKVMTIPEILKLLVGAIEIGPETFQVVLFLLSTGMKVGECDKSNLHWSEISFANRRYSYLLKNRRHPRMVSKRFTNIVEGIFLLRKQFSPIKPFNRNSEYISKHIVKPVFKKTGLEYTAHDLRRTAGGHVYLETHDIYRAMEFLNHTSVDTTTQHYVRLTSRDKYVCDITLSQIQAVCLQYVNIKECKLDQSDAFQWNGLRKALNELLQQIQ